MRIVMPRYTIEEFQGKRVIYDNTAKKIVHVEFFFGRDFERLCIKLNEEVGKWNPTNGKS